LLNDRLVEAGSPFELNRGDVLVLELPGGGGFGAVEERDPLLQEADRKDGLL
jgi:N-methylhydantoinase B/oxoprolinase/acetone carboxylase alpha subunit